MIHLLSQLSDNGGLSPMDVEKITARADERIQSIITEQLTAMTQLMQVTLPKSGCHQWLATLDTLFSKTDTLSRSVQYLPKGGICTHKPESADENLQICREFCCRMGGESAYEFECDAQERDISAAVRGII